MARFEEGDPLWPFFKITASIQRAYLMVFGAQTSGSATVLVDLAKYCFAEAATTTEREAGRRDVWLHIRRRLALRDDELAAIYARLTPQQRLAIFDPATPVAFPQQKVQ